LPLFWSRKGTTADITGPVRIDPAMGDAPAARLRSAMAAADWTTARGIIAGASDAQDQSFYTKIAADVPGSEEWLPGVIRADLTDVLALLVYGARAIVWAWEARTTARARYVSREQFEVFFERLHVAEDALQAVVRRDPDMVPAWHQLLTTARGLRLGVDEARRRFEEVDSRCPGHLFAHRQMLQMLCAKWYGSHEEMHAFARESLARSPFGSPVGSLVAVAHLENWLHLGTDSQRAHYVRRRSVRDSLRDAADSSVCHPDYRRAPGWPEAHNDFAMAFCLAGDYPAAAEQFRSVGAIATKLPWGYLGDDPGTTFAAYRRRALQKAPAR